MNVRLLAVLLLAPAAVAQLPAAVAGHSQRLGTIDPADSAYGLPPGFADEVVLHDLDQAVGLTFVPGGGPGYVWLKSGRIQVLSGLRLLDQPLLDISDEVADHGDLGLLSVALDPQFASNGYLYLLYDVDHYALFHADDPNYDPNENEYDLDTLARVTRYTADAATGFTTLVPGSRLVLAGAQPGDGPLVSGKTHGIGSLVFGNDGTLLVSTGDASATPGSGTAVSDGLILPKEDVGPWRSQLVDSLSGKLLRLDPATGDGVPGNPFFDPAAPRAPRSRVWTLGLRNPCRFTVRPGTGSSSPADADPGVVIVGDVGAEAVEEVSVVDAPGLDLGWPIREGMSPGPLATATPPNLDAPNPSFGQAGCTQPYFLFTDLFTEDSALPPFWPDPCQPGQQLVTSAPKFVHHRPVLDWHHYEDIARVPAFDGAGAAITVTLGQPGCAVLGVPFAGNCSISGAWCGDADWPAGWGDAYYHVDYGVGWIRRLDFDPQSHLLGVVPFAQPVGKVVWLCAHPDDGAIWYIDYGVDGQGNLHRIDYFGGNLPPVAHADAMPAWGPLPLTVTFQSVASVDPEGLPLGTRWDFSDGTPFSLLPAPVRELPVEDVTALGTPIAEVLTQDPPGSTGFSNPDIEVIRDGDRPLVGTIDNQRQYDTIHTNAQGQNDKPTLDWIGYTFPTQRTFTGLLFQEGMNYQGGGWFGPTTLYVQVHSPLGWRPVKNQVSDPPYPGDTTVNFETFEFRFAPTTGDGIRLIGIPGGFDALKFVTIGELRALARPLQSAPEGVTATLTVTDTAGSPSEDVVHVAAGDAGPPQITGLLPLTGGTYSALGPTPVDVDVKATDPDDAGDLSGTWQIILHHNNHTHPEPITPGLQQHLVILPEGACGTGDVYWTELRCTVSDPLGLQTTGSIWLVPDCDLNLNGLDDRTEIAANPSLDHDHDGLIDSTQTDCDGDGVPDFAAIHFGLATDSDGDGVPDGCHAGFSTGKAHKPPQGPPR